MTFDLASSAIGFRLSMPDGTWEVWPRAGGGPRLERSEMSLAWRRRGRWHRSPIRCDGAVKKDVHEVETVQGRCQSLTVVCPPDRQGLALTLEWRIGAETPLLLWRACIANQGKEPVQIGRIELMRVGHIHGKGAAGGDRDDPVWRWCGASPGDLRFFSNGWQSWNYTGSYGPGDRPARTRLGPLTSPARVNAGTPQPRARGHFGSDLFGVVADSPRRSGVLVGFLSQREAFGSLEVKLASRPPRMALWANGDGIRLDPGKEFATDWACLQYVGLDAPDPLEPYLEAVARENGARRDGPVPVGWCSWYYFLQKVTEKDILSNLAWATEHLAEIPLKLIQIDDGFEADVGDWFGRAAGFPGDLAELSRRIRGAGFQPGLWLAPFIIKPTSRLARECPEWVVGGRFGLPANAGFNWNTFSRALDVTQPQVLDWVRGLIRTATREWGFDYLKLDFLYAAAIPGKRQDATITRAQALHKALSVIREEAGPKVTLAGCGCPLGSGIGIFDSMRIGEDVAARWEPAYKGIEFFFNREPDFPSARHAIRNTLARAPLHRRWWVNDPDCLLVRDTQEASGSAATRRGGVNDDFVPDAHLTEAEVQSLATTIALSAGSLIVSDHLPHLSEERRAWLARLIPPLPQAARVVDWMESAYPSRLVLPLSGVVGRWHLVAFLNWDNGAKDATIDLSSLGLPQSADYHLLDYWGERYRCLQGPRLDLPQLEAHGAFLAAVRPVGAPPQYLGDTLHVSQGLSIHRWQPSEERLSAEVVLGRRGRGTAWLSLPAEPIEAIFAGRTIPWRREGEGIYALPLDVDGEGDLEIRWA